MRLQSIEIIGNDVLSLSLARLDDLFGNLVILDHFCLGLEMIIDPVLAVLKMTNNRKSKSSLIFI